jgi:hypothetical protein
MGRRIRKSSKAVLFNVLSGVAASFAVYHDGRTGIHVHSVPETGRMIDIDESQLAIF